MLKTPAIGPVVLILALAAASVGLATTSIKPAAPARPSAAVSNLGFNALDGRRLEQPVPPTYGGEPQQNWDVDGVHEAGGDSPRQSIDLNGLDPSGAAGADALPLAQLGGADGKSAPAKARPGVWDVFRIHYGGLPEPASWGLILVGFGMIGGALRGFIVANRRLARLQPSDQD